MFTARLAAGVSWWFCGSSVVGSTPWAMTTTPGGDAAEATAGTSKTTDRNAGTNRRMGSLL